MNRDEVLKTYEDKKYLHTTGKLEMHPTEEKYPIQTSGFKNIIEKMYEIHLDKNKDYSPANILVAGKVGVLVRVWDKFCRICNLSGMTFPIVRKDLDNLKKELQYVRFPVAGSKITKEQEERYLEKHEILAKKIDDIIKKTEFNYSNVSDKVPGVKDESIDDTWLDMANYCIIAYLQRKGQWGC